MPAACLEKAICGVKGDEGLYVIFMCYNVQTAILAASIYSYRLYCHLWIIGHNHMYARDGWVRQHICIEYTCACTCSRARAREALMRMLVKASRAHSVQDCYKQRICEHKLYC